VFSYLLYENEVGRIIRSKGHWVSWLLCTEAVLLQRYSVWRFMVHHV